MERQSLAAWAPLPAALGKSIPKDYVNKQPKYIQYVNIFLCSQKEIWLKCLRGIRAANAKEC